MPADAPPLAPDPGTVRRYLLGQLPAPEAEVVGRYFEAHPDALPTLADAAPPDDTLLAAVRKGPALPPLDTPEVRRLADWAKGLAAGATAEFPAAVAGQGTRTAPPEHPGPEEAPTEAEDDPATLLRPPEGPGELGRLGGYRVLRVLGRGGMGMVLEAEEPRAGRHVALKVMLPSAARNPAARERFLREARAAAAVEHDHVVPIYFVGEEGGVPFIVMPLLRGESLDDRLKRARTLSAAEVSRIGREVAEGLAAAHERGLIHRDIKPGNIWLEAPRDRAKLLDFGLARATQAGAEITHTGAVLGTPAYMSPEQARGQGVDARSDLFSLGGVLYRAATGRIPFSGSDAMTVLMSLATDTPADPRSLNPQVPPHLAALIQRLLEKAPAKRPQSAAEVARLLSPSVEPLPAEGPSEFDFDADAREAIPEATPVAAPAGKRSRVGRLVGAAVAVLLVGVGITFAPTVIRVATNKGELVIEVDDPDIEVVVKGADAEVRDKAKDRTFVLKAGTGQVEFLDPETGATAVTKKFEITRGGKTRLTATMAEVAAARPKDRGGPDRKAAEYVLSVGGKVRVIEDGKEGNPTAVGDLPRGPFELRVIDLSQNGRVTDADLARLKACKELTHLFLDGTPVTDAGLAHLAGCTNLTLLSLRTTKVSAQGVAEFKKALPNCKIDWDGGYTNGLGMEFARVPKGKAWLGGGGGTPGDRVVEFKEDFYLGVYEVTQEEWEKVTGAAQPSAFSRNGTSKDAVKDIPDADLKRFPVENINWDEAQLFVKKLNDLDPQPGWTYRLPTEDEWEYACRGGPVDRLTSSFDFYFEKPTNVARPDQANGRAGLQRTCKVGSYQPNALGLYDMHGNVFEWCIRAESAEDGSPSRQTRGGGHGAGIAKAKDGKAWARSFRAWDGGLRVARVRVPASAPQPAVAAAPFDEKKARAHQEAWAAHLGRKVVEENGLQMKLILIPPGTFRMGAADPEKDGKTTFKAQKEEAPAHEVELTRPFLLGATEVTQGQFQQVMGRSPSEFSAQGKQAEKVKGLDTGPLPVESVTWYDAAEFCNLLSKREGLPPFYELKFPIRQKDGSISAADVKELGGNGYRLPTEAEWEHACRAGTETPFSFTFDYATLGQYGWFGYGTERPHPTGDRKPNPFGLSDMHGNVFEWCNDWSGPYAAAAARDPRGPDSGTERVNRGGCWNYLPEYARSAFRGKLKPGGRMGITGFRVARSLDPAPAADPDRRAAEWVLSVGGKAYLDGPNRAAAGDLPKGTFRLTGLDLGGVAQVDDAALARFKDCTNLLAITLAETKVGDSGLANFKQCKNLNYVHLRNTNVTDAGLVHFKDCKGLTYLALSGTKVTDAGLAHFRENKSFTALDLGLPQVTDAGLAHFRGCKGLGTLYLGGTQVTDAGLAHFSDCPNLRDLILDGTQVTDAGLAHFKDRKGLTGLRLSQTKVTDAGLAYFTDCKGLGRLDLFGTQITDAGLEHLRGLTGLRSINLGMSKRVTAGGVKKLAAALPRCKIVWDGGTIEPTADPDRRAAEWVLSVGDGQHTRIRVTEGGKERETRELPAGPFELTGVILQHNQKVKDADMARLKDCKNLTLLHLGYTNIGDPGLAHLQEFNRLTALHLAGGTRTTDAGLASFKDCKDLVILDLHGVKVTEAGLAFFKDCPKLEQFGLRSSNLTGVKLDHFKDRKGLTHLDLADTRVDPAELRHFQGCTALTHLDLGGVLVTDTEAGYFHGCKNLRFLNLAKTKVTDKGLAPFRECKSLTHLRVVGTAVTKDGIDALKAALPRCRIEHDGGTIEPNPAGE